MPLQTCFSQSGLCVQAQVMNVLEIVILKGKTIMPAMKKMNHDPECCWAEFAAER